MASGMSDHAAFMRAIVESPNDDLPRLIYADYLDERGESCRAEFIRVQVELSRSKCDRDPAVACAAPGGPVYARPVCHWCKLRLRERELLGGGDGPSSIPKSGVWAIRSKVAWCDDWRHHRGFISNVACSWHDFARNAETILANCPIRNAKDGLVRLTTMPPCHGPEWRLISGSAVFLENQYPGVRFELPLTEWQRAERDRSPITEVEFRRRYAVQR